MTIRATFCCAIAPCAAGVTLRSVVDALLRVLRTAALLVGWAVSPSLQLKPVLRLLGRGVVCRLEHGRDCVCSACGRQVDCDWGTARVRAEVLASKAVSRWPAVNCTYAGTGRLHTHQSGRVPQNTEAKA